MKLPRWTTFYGGRKHTRTKFFFLPLNLSSVAKNSIPEKFTGILHFKQIEIIDLQPEDFLILTLSLRSQSLLPKLPSRAVM